MSPRIMAALLILVLHHAPANPSLAYMNTVVEICADIYGVDANLCRCIVLEESQWNPRAKPKTEAALGLWQWHEESIRYTFRDMEIHWDWTADGDPRLNVWASTLAACHALSKGWDWWSTRELCEEPARES